MLGDLKCRIEAIERPREIPPIVNLAVHLLVGEGYDEFDIIWWTTVPVDDVEYKIHELMDRLESYVVLGAI